MNNYMWLLFIGTFFSAFSQLLLKQSANKTYKNPIVEYLKENHPDIPVIKFEQDTKEYDVKLKGGIELTFDKQFRLIDYDD